MRVRFETPGLFKLDSLRRAATLLSYDVTTNASHGPNNTPLYAYTHIRAYHADVFATGAQRRCILVYSGIHYDSVSLSPNDRLGFGRKSEPEDDVKTFDSDDDVVLATALDLCRKLREKHYYTDTANFTIKCNICGWAGNGEKGATEHAAATGHMNFGES